MLGRRVATWWRTRTLPRQKSLLEDLRDSDEYLLVVLDACRWDDFQEIAQHSIDGHMTPVRSAGRDTFEYVRRCWPDEYPKTTYVSGATPVNSGSLVYDEDFQRLYQGYTPSEHIGEIVDVWDTAWDDSLGTVPPEAVVAETIDRLDEDHLICHLFQPHAPYIGDVRLLGHHCDQSATPREGEPVDKPIWDRVESGEITNEQLWSAYRNNLSRALNAACWLVDEVDRDVVVMGDHGEALGEWGIYAHPRVAHPKIRTVPWCRVDELTTIGERRSAAARKTFAEQAAAPVRENSSGDQEPEQAGVRGRLEGLGYL